MLTGSFDVYPPIPIGASNVGATPPFSRLAREISDRKSNDQTKGLVLDGTLGIGGRYGYWQTEANVFESVNAEVRFVFPDYALWKTKGRVLDLSSRERDLMSVVSTVAPNAFCIGTLPRFCEE